MLPQSILDDNTSGSSDIANKVVEWLKSNVSANANFNDRSLDSEFDKLQKSFPHFAALLHFMNSAMDFLAKQLVTINPAAKAENFQKFLENYQLTWTENQKSAARRMVSELDFLKKTVLLHSHSGSLKVLFEMLKHEAQKPLIIQTVSEPGKEGIVQARHLAEMGFEVLLINEAATSRFMNEVDIFISGTDAIYKDFVINKTGSLPLALTCRYFKKPYYILTDERKMFTKPGHVISSMSEFSESGKPEHEIMLDSPKKIRPVNFYFEPVPIDLVEKIFTG